MTGQNFSFIFWGLVFLLLFIFYRKENRKIILILFGILVFLPFTFGFISYSHDNTILLWIISFILIFRISFYGGRNWYFAIPFILYFFAIPLTTRSVVIINNTLKSTHKTIFTSTLKFKYKSGETVFLAIEGGELINNTGSKLYIETVEYGNGIFGSENNNQIIAEIEPYSCSLLHQRIDFYFVEPPSRLNISRKRGEPMPNTVIKYWLHK